MKKCQSEEQSSELERCGEAGRACAHLMKALSAGRRIVLDSAVTNCLTGALEPTQARAKSFHAHALNGKLHGRVSWLAGTAVSDYQRARVYFTTPSLTVTQRRCWTHSFSFQSHPICMLGSFWARDSARSTRKNTAAQAQMQPHA
jgi:hypothetical protein